MGHVIPTGDHTLKEIFKDKVPGMDQDHDLISPELIAYLKWLIYVAPYGDRSMVDHEEFYENQVAFYRDPAYYKIWRSLLYRELDAWYTEHPSSKKRRSKGAASGRVTVVNRKFQNVDDFIDLLDDDAGAGGASAPAAGVALAAAAAAESAASLGAGAVGGPV
jgi:hypothetical protein